MKSRLQVSTNVNVNRRSNDNGTSLHSRIRSLQTLLCTIWFLRCLRARPSLFDEARVSYVRRARHRTTVGVPGPPGNGRARVLVRFPRWRRACQPPSSAGYKGAPFRPVLPSPGLPSSPHRMHSCWYLFHPTRPPSMFAVFHFTRPPHPGPTRGQGTSPLERATTPGSPLIVCGVYARLLDFEDVL